MDFSADKKDERSVSNNTDLLQTVNINTATISELQLLPGIGIKTAEKIIELRNRIGGFERLEDLLAIEGIGKAKFNSIKKFLIIEKNKKTLNAPEVK